MKLAISLLCENPQRRTGLSTLFPAFVAEARRQFPELEWIVFAGPGQPWPVADERVEVVRRFSANDRLAARLWADHFRVAAEARRRGAAGLLTVGFHPVQSAGLPVIMHAFSLHHLRGGGLRNAYRRWAMGRGLRRAALVIVNSQWTAGQLPERPRRLLVSPEGVEAGRFRADGAAGDPSLPRDYLLWVGNFYPYKRAELALAAYARLPAERRARHLFLFAGGDWQGGRARAETVAARLGLDRNVRFLGWVDDAMLPALYRGARAHVLSTSEETFGRSVTEAMACGCPCVLQDLPVLREVTGGAALFTDFADAMKAGAALDAVCADDTAAVRLRAAGLQRAAEFSFSRLARERVGAILDLLGRQAR